MLITRRKNVVGESSGKTMVQKRRVGVAPSIAAASSSDRGIDCSPARSTLNSAVTLNDSRYSRLRKRSVKLSNQTKVLDCPNGSCTRKEYQTACAAGQKKNTTVTAICGATSA